MDAADLIRAYLDAFNRGDRPAMLALLAEDVAHDVNQGGREVGRDCLRRLHGADGPLLSRTASWTSS